MNFDLLFMIGCFVAAVVAAIGWAKAIRQEAELEVLRRTQPVPVRPGSESIRKA